MPGLLLLLLAFVWSVGGVKDICEGGGWGWCWRERGGLRERKVASFAARAAAVAAVGICIERAGAHRRRSGRSGLREKRFAWGVID